MSFFRKDGFAFSFMRFLLKSDGEFLLVVLLLGIGGISNVEFSGWIVGGSEITTGCNKLRGTG
eukprot:TRINITY_DN39605_c0_g1_i1.p2 TRINITY_DN39605_c0_g1~~TRINITY_DN39605_c0_g1_i1.p2  ORF type:complete len:63 (+),score=9.37 TRINITY_DN39605_c0_g1_i1:213-401(+)